MAKEAIQRPHIPVTQSLGTFLRKKRENSGLSQNELADKLGYQSGQVVSNWERGLQSPPFIILAKLSKILNISQSEIVSFLLREQKRIYEDAFTGAKRELRRA